MESGICTNGREKCLICNRELVWSKGLLVCPVHDMQADKVEGEK
jgi:uncharacterized Zn finger protein (UPF0148 family)